MLARKQKARRAAARVRKERLLNCTSSSSGNGEKLPNPGRILCVEASPNPEFAANPGNFAHFWMAFMFPFVISLREAGVPGAEIFRSRLLIWHGNNAVLPKWSPQLAGLLGSTAPARCDSAVRRVNSSPTELAMRRSAFGCSVRVRIGVPLFSFRNRSFYHPVRWRAFAAAMRAQLAVVRARGEIPAPAAFAPSTRLEPAVDALRTPRRAVVLLREGTSNRHVLGLEAACSLPNVACVRPGPGESLVTVASVLAHPSTRALVAGHGAALALLPFLPHGSRTLELDHVSNIGRARNMYVYLGEALGFDAFKVWLNASGSRFCPRRVLACTMSAGGTTVHGCSVGYTGQVLLTASMLRHVLRDALDDQSSSAALVTARACSGVFNDSWRGRKWWNIRSELDRPFPEVYQA